MNYKDTEPYMSAFLKIDLLPLFAAKNFWIMFSIFSTKNTTLYCAILTPVQQYILITYPDPKPYRVLIYPTIFTVPGTCRVLYAVLRIRNRIRIHRIHMFLGLLDPDPLVTGMDPDPDPALDPDPDPSIIMQK